MPHSGEGNFANYRVLLWLTDTLHLYSTGML